MQSSLSHLENIDPRFLDPDASFVVMCESIVSDLDDVRLALNGLSAIFDCAAGMNAGLRQAGAAARCIDLPPDGMAALLRVLGEKLKPAIHNPSLGAVQRIRPDLFARRSVGGL